MKYDILRPIIMTIIAIGSLRTTEDRNELLSGDLWLWFIVIVFIASWIDFFMRRKKS